MALNSRTMFDVGSLLWILKSSWKVAKTKRKIDNNELRWPTIYSTHAQPPHGWRTNTGEFTRIARALWIYIHPSIQLPYKECAMERIPEAMESFVWIRENPVRSRSVSPVCYIVCAVKYVATTYTNICSNGIRQREIHQRTKGKALSHAHTQTLVSPVFCIRYKHMCTPPRRNHFLQWYEENVRREHCLDRTRTDIRMKFS